MKTKSAMAAALVCAVAFSLTSYNTADAMPPGPPPGPGPGGPPPHWGGPWGPWGGPWNSTVIVMNDYSSTPQVRQNDPARFSVCGIRPGISTATELVKVFGRPNDIDCTHSDAYHTAVYIYTYKKLDMVAVVCPDDSIHSISLGEESPLKVDIGLGINNTVEHLANAYGDAIDQTLHPYHYNLHVPGRYQYTLPIYNTNEATTINYFTIDDIVDHITITHIFSTVNHPVFFPEDTRKKNILIDKLIAHAKEAMSDKKYVLAGDYIDSAFEFADKTDIRPYQARAELYRTQKKYKKAQKELMKAQKIAPDNEELNNEITSLQDIINEQEKAKG